MSILLIIKILYFDNFIMKKIIISLFAFMAVVSLAGCNTNTTNTNCGTNNACTLTETGTVRATTGEVNDGFTLYTNADHGFSIQYPNTWEYQENAFGSHVMFFSPQPKGDAFRENVGVITEVLSGDIDVDTYYAAAKEHLASFISDFNETMNKNFKLGEFNAKKVQYIGTQWTYTLKWQQVFFIKDHVAYVITYTAMKDTFDDYLADVDAMIHTITLN